MKLASGVKLFEAEVIKKFDCYSLIKVGSKVEVGKAFKVSEDGEVMVSMYRNFESDSEPIFWANITQEEAKNHLKLTGKTRIIK